MGGNRRGDGQRPARIELQPFRDAERERCAALALVSKRLKFTARDDLEVGFEGVYRQADRAEAAAEATIDLAAGGVWLEVSRADANIIMRALDSATFTFRSAVQRGETLARATEVALVADSAFDLCRALPALFLDGAIIAVSLAQSHAGSEIRQ